MAFKRAPEQDTYSTVEFPIFSDLNTRSFPGTAGTAETSKDAMVYNLNIDTILNRATGEKELTFTKRCGTANAVVTALPGTAKIRGAYWWAGASAKGRLVLIIQDALTSPSDLDIVTFDPPADATNTEWVINTTYDKALPAGYTLNGTTSVELFKVSFAEFLYDSGAVDLVISDELGGTLVKINQAGTLATCGDAQLPAGLIDIQYVDGYLVGVKPGTADIYNSDLNDPFLWTAGNFITAEQFGDTIYRLTIQNNYIVAFGKSSIEYFYNAGIATGSPFQRNASMCKQMAYFMPIIQSLRKIGDDLYMIGNYVGQGVDLYKITNESVIPIGGPLLKKLMSQYFYGTTSAYELNDVYAGIVHCPKTGHTFYVLTVSGSTYALNLSNGTWSNWARASTGEFPIYTGLVFDTIGPSRHFSLAVTVDGVYMFQGHLVQDSGTNFLIKLQTNLQDFGTMNQKTMNRLALVTDTYASSSGVTMTLSYTDDDYRTWSTQYSVSLDLKHPAVTRLGRFRRRALYLFGTFNEDFTLYKIEVDINKGSH